MPPLIPLKVLTQTAPVHKEGAPLLIGVLLLSDILN